MTKLPGEPLMSLDPDYHVAQIEAAGQRILDVRQPYLEAGRTLAWLYDPATMPDDLLAAHKANDEAVDSAYIAAELLAGRKRPDFRTEEKRVAFLMGAYLRMTAPEREAKAEAERYARRELW